MTRAAKVQLRCDNTEHDAPAMKPASYLSVRLSFAATVLTDDESLSGDAFHARTLRVAAGLKSLGVHRGDCVALLLRNDTPFLQATVAAQQLGAYAVPLNWHFKRDELLYVIGDCGPTVLVAHADRSPCVAGARWDQRYAVTLSERGIGEPVMP